MAAEIFGAVLRCGPGDSTARFILAVLGDIAGAEGLAWPNVTTIAERCCISARTVTRVLDDLERDGWLRVLRKHTLPAEFAGFEFAQGKQSVYLLTLTKLGLTPETSPRLFQRQKFSPDMVSGETERRLARSADGDSDALRPTERRRQASQRTPSTAPGDASPDTMSAEKLRDPQALSGHSTGVHGTSATESPDISSRLTGHSRQRNIRSEPEEPDRTGEPDSTNQSPLPPTPSAGGEAKPFFSLKNELRQMLRFDQPCQPNFKPVREGENDYDACFADMQLLGQRVARRGDGRAFRLALDAPDRGAMTEGLLKYQRRFKELVHKHFEVPRDVEIEITFPGVGFTSVDGVVPLREIARAF